MKKVFFRNCLTLLSCTLTYIVASAQDIVPQPVAMSCGEGYFTIPRNVAIWCSPDVRAAVDIFADKLASASANKISPKVTVRARQNDRIRRIYIYSDPLADLPAEGYTLRIIPREVLLIGKDYGGVFNGIQTLRQLFPAKSDAGETQFDYTCFICADMVDYPRFSYRGMHLDVARTFSTADDVKRYIDNMSAHKLNTFHWHLTDDEGWRIEIKSHPELAEIAGFRGGDSPVMPIYGKWDEKYGGYYTQEQVKEIVAYAAARNVEIVPEIELPGHSRAAGKALPAILCSNRPDTAASAGYDRRDAWCVAKEENYALLDDILSEVAALFPSRYIHIGGDEVDPSSWLECPDCRALMESGGWTKGSQLQHHFTSRVSGILARYGKLPAVWNESMDGGSLDSATRIHGWQNTGECLKSVRSGYPTVVMPGKPFYFDMKQSAVEPGLEWAGIVTLGDVYNFGLAKSGFTAEDMQNVIGFEGAMWTEVYLSQGEGYLDYQTYPRICALSELAWTPDAGRDWIDFQARLERSHYARLRDMGIGYRTVPAEKGPAPRQLFPAVKVASSMEAGKRNPYSNLESYRGRAGTARTCMEGDWIVFTFDSPVVCDSIGFRTGYHYLNRSVIPSGYVEVSYDVDKDNGLIFERDGNLRDGAITIKPQDKRAVRAIRIVSTAPRNGESTVFIQPLAVYAAK